MLVFFAFVLTATACGSGDDAGRQDAVYAGAEGTKADGLGAGIEGTEVDDVQAEEEQEAETKGTTADGQEDDRETHGKEDGDSQEIDLAGAENTDLDSELDVWEAYETILSGCSRELICGYLIDEAFLAWMTADYGKESVFALAEAVKTGCKDEEIWHQLTGNSLHVLWSQYCKESGYQDYYLERVYWKTCADPEQIVIDFVGDVNFAEGWSTIRYLDQQIDGLYDCMSPALLEELNQADILMVNNEFAYSTRGTPIEGKDYTFRADPDRVYLLEIMGADIVSLANNHAYDFGPEALLDTLDTLQGAGIPYVGAGANLREAMTPVYFIANGRKIAIVSATQVERTLNYTKEATETEPGVLKTLDPNKFVTVIEEANENADYVIVYVHWGTEQNPHFEKDQMALADAYIEAGADAIIGGHTHCLQGCEYREEVPIIYSLGNFWFNSNKLDTGIAQLVIQKDGSMDFRFLPCIQKRNETYLVEEETEKQRIWDYLQSISSGVEIDSEGYIRKGQ